MSARAKQSGVALITAILVVALATIAAATVLVSANAAIHRTALLQDSERAAWLADGVEGWIATLLARDEDLAVDHLGEEWAQPVDYLPVDEGVARGVVLDAQGRFNINNLDPGPRNSQAARAREAMAQFERLLAELAPDAGGNPRDLAAAVVDWLDEDQEPFPESPGAEDPQYLGETLPYLPANRKMRSVSELLAVRGVTPEIYQALTASPACAVDEVPQPCITALPEFTAVNVNTAPRPVLAALRDPRDPAVDVNKLDLFIASRREKPCEQLTDCDAGLHEPGGRGPGRGSGDRTLDVRSSYFQVRGEVVFGSGRAALYSLIRRPPPPDKGQPVVIDHSSDE